ncbi:MAG: hypothetical protein DHS20C01_35220 [marine bacterium B5-7]|nr:MAG: hypothetical protein DHS20C01_35220 [marine bacterium B5-7]
MRIAVPTQCISDDDLGSRPWIKFRGELASHGIFIETYKDAMQAFEQEYDAMMLDIWLDWENGEHFRAEKILPIMGRYAEYRSKYPHTRQIILNHTDMSCLPYATPYWRYGDPVLFRTPAYDRRLLSPFPPQHIWSFEKVWGSARFMNHDSGNLSYPAGFAGTSSGPDGYRQAVANATACVGVGLCSDRAPLAHEQYRQLIQQCEILVCPRGWGEQSERHWDAWLSGKPVLTDRDCASVEMIPGIHLREGVHYLVYDDPEDIPDIVSEWTRPSRRSELARIATNGYHAARSYDPFVNILKFFNWVRDGMEAPVTVPRDVIPVTKIRKRLLITGSSRSGTHFISRLLNEAGIDIYTEAMGDDGIVSWCLTADTPNVPWGPAKTFYSFDQIWHQVRHPLSAIAATQILDIHTWDFIYEQIPEIDPDEPLILQCAKYWYYWNCKAEEIAGFRYRIEDLQSAWSEITTRLGLSVDDDFLAHIDTWGNAHKHKYDPVTWDELERLDRPLTDKIRNKAIAYGYESQPIARPLSPHSDKLIKLYPDEVVIFYVEYLNQVSLAEFLRIKLQCGDRYDTALIYRRAEDANMVQIVISRCQISQFDYLMSPGCLDKAVLEYYYSKHLYRHYWVIRDGVSYDGNWLDFLKQFDPSVFNSDCMSLTAKITQSDRYVSESEKEHRSLSASQLGRKEFAALRISLYGMQKLGKFSGRDDAPVDAEFTVCLERAGLSLEEVVVDCLQIRPQLETVIDDDDFRSTLPQCSSPGVTVRTLSGIRFEKLDESRYILLRDSTVLLSMSQSAALIWELCTKAMSVEEMTNVILTLVPVGERTVVADVYSTLQRFKRAGVIEYDDHVQQNH